MLQLVSDPSPSVEPWDRRQGESEAEHGCFWEWVRLGTPSLTGEALSLARRQGWTQRATELTERLRAPSSPRAELDQIRRDAMATLRLGMRALRRRAEELTARDLRYVQEIVANLDAAAVNAEASTLPLEDLPDSALETIEKAISLVDSVRKTG